MGTVLVPSGRKIHRDDALLIESFTDTLTGASPKTLERRRLATWRFAQWFDDRLLNATFADIDRWRDSESAVRLRRCQYVYNLGEFFRWASMHGLTSRNPVAELLAIDRDERDQERDARSAAGTADYVREYGKHLQRRGLVENTIERNVHELRVLGRWLHPYGVLQASHTDIERFLDERAGRSADGQRVPLDPGTRRQWISAFASFYRWAVAEELTTVDPTMRIIRPKIAQHLPRPIRDRDLQIAVAHAERDNPLMHTMLLLGAYEGLRCIEIAACSVEWIVGDLLRVRGKGNKDRTVPLHPDVRKSLERLTLPSSGLVLPQTAPGRWTPRRVSLDISRYLSGLGIDATAHQLRHWFGTKTYAATRDLRLVQELMGHSSIQTTAIYTALVPGPDAFAAVRALGVSS